MKKIRYLIFVLLVLLSINVKAANKCETKEFDRLKELAKKVEFDYDYKMVKERAMFSITAVNLNSDLRVLIIEDYYADKYKEFKNNDTHTATLDNFYPGDKVVITIKGFVPNWCSGKTVLTKTIKLPYYNYFYDEEKCRGNEDFKYCKVLIDSDISQKTFDTQFKNYLKNKENNNKPEVKHGIDTFTLLIIIGSIVGALAVIVLVTLYIIKRRKKNSL